MAKKDREKKEKFLQWLAPGMLAVVAIIQIILAYHGLSPWRGGGFGMFATIDRPAERRFSCVGQGADGSEFEILLEPEMFAAGDAGRYRLLRDALAQPTHARLRRVGEWLLESGYSRANGEFIDFKTVAEGRGYASQVWLNGIELSKLHLDTAKFSFLRPGGSEVRLRAVQVAVMRLNLDPEGMVLEWTPVGMPVLTGNPA